MSSHSYFPQSKKKESGSDKTSITLYGRNSASAKVSYDYAGTIARQGHAPDRILHTSYSALVPLRGQAQKQAGSIDEESERHLKLSRPSPQEIKDRQRLTKESLDTISSSLTMTKSSLLNPQQRFQKKNDPQFIKYTPSSNQSGRPAKSTLIKMVDVQEDPFAPAKFKHTKVPAGPSSPPAPVLRSPPRKVTAEEQKEWSIPPSLSNWKNPKGFTIDVDKRVAADGRQQGNGNAQDILANDKKAKFAEALFLADKAAREEIRAKQELKRSVAEQEAELREERLRDLARKARQERKHLENTAVGHSDRYIEKEPMTDGERNRWRDRDIKLKEAEKELRMSRMGADRRVKMQINDQGREISEQVALGVSQPSKATLDSQFDSRLYDQGSMSSRISEDQVYDKSLFAAHDAVRSIYRPKLGANFDVSDADAAETAQANIQDITKSDRFGLKERLTGQDREQGPVQFEKDDNQSLKRAIPAEESSCTSEPLRKKSRWDVR